MRTVCALSMLSASCIAPNNAVLELYLELPAASDEYVAASVQVRRWEPGIFDAEWHSERDVDPVPLGAVAELDHVSVQTEDAEMDVAVRVSFCRASACSDAVPDRREYRLLQPFFFGVRSEWHRSLRLPEGTSSIVDVDQCEMRACVTGDLAPDYCDDEGRHPCQ